ncbi:MAG: hypothetical protein HQM10_19465 [Candidatus Riflebacteria bacterium]|nr:hypothetical protein [Candidatus Riflebacteria bacterium]
MKKILFSVAVILLTLVFVASSEKAEAQTDPSLVSRIERCEVFVFGKKYPDSATERVNRLERELLGQKSSGELVSRSSNIFNFLFIGTQKSPSLELKVRFLEWKSFREVREGALAERLAKLDEFVSGQTTSEPFAFRVEQLIQMTVEKGLLLLHKIKVPAGTSLRVKIGKTVSSSNADVGDEVPLIVQDDLILSKNILVFPKGGKAVGDLDQVRKSGRFGRQGKLRFVVRKAVAIDGTSLPVSLKDLSGNDIDKKKLGMAVGASTVGYLAMGPVGLVGGIFVKGKDVTIPEGTELLISVTEDTYVNGVLISGK